MLGWLGNAVLCHSRLTYHLIESTFNSNEYKLVNSNPIFGGQNYNKLKVNRVHISNSPAVTSLSSVPPVQSPLTNKVPLFCPSPFSTDIFSADVCGQNKELDVETCQCVCRHRDQTQDCGPNQHIDHNTCQCACNVPTAASCPLNHIFNKDTCQCACVKTCPRHQPLNKTKCSCECNESPNKCFLKGRRFHPATCR